MTFVYLIQMIQFMAQTRNAVCFFWGGLSPSIAWYFNPCHPSGETAPEGHRQGRSHNFETTATM